MILMRLDLLSGGRYLDMSNHRIGSNRNSPMSDEYRNVKTLWLNIMTRALLNY